MADSLSTLCSASNTRLLEQPSGRSKVDRDSGLPSNRDDVGQSALARDHWHFPRPLCPLHLVLAGT